MNLAGLMRAASLLPVIVGAVHAVETIAANLRGKDKQDAAVTIIKSMVLAAEGVAGVQVFDDASVDAAIRGVIDGYVTLANAATRKSATVIAVTP